MKRSLPFVLVCVLILLVQAALGQSIPIVAELDSTFTGSGSFGRGTFFGVLDVPAKSLTYQVTVNKLQGSITNAHFHDENTAILQAITFSGNTASGTWSNMPDSALLKIVNQRIYVNIHTSAFGSGEISGFTGAQSHGFGVKMDGAQAGQATNGKGTGFVDWDSAAVKVRFHMTYAGLNAPITAAHFHSARNTGIVQAIAFTDSTAEGSWTLPDTALNLLIKGELYVNIHTAFAGTGEIRGTVVPYGQFSFPVEIDGAKAGTISTAKGTAWAVLDRFATKLTYDATYNGLGSAYQAAHFHNAGGILHAVTFTNNNASGEWTSLTDANLQDLLKGNIYLNIHSVNFSGGEIRGNLKRADDDDAIWTASLDGTQAGTASTGKGTAWLSLHQEDSVRVRVTIAGLTSPFSAAHVHAANDGVMIPITFTDSTGTAVAFRPDSLLLQLIKQQPYVNVHSTAFGGGEIRGNLKFGSGIVTNVEQTSGAIPATFVLQQNYPNPFNPATTVVFSLTRTEKVTLRIYNLLGQVVATPLNEVRGPGTHTIVFEASGLTSGVYFYRLETSTGLVETKRMVLIR